jgi:hypothetical protein
VQQDAKRFSNWLVTHFNELDLDKDGVAEWKEMDKLDNSPLAQTPEFKTAREKWWALTHIIEEHESESGITLRDAKTLSEAFNPLESKSGYKYEQAERISSLRSSHYGPSLTIESLMIPPMVAFAFAGPPGWALDGIIGGAIGIMEGINYFPYKKQANEIRSLTAQNYYEYKRRDILSRGVFGELHRNLADSK